MSEDVISNEDLRVEIQHPTTRRSAKATVTVKLQESVFHEDRVNLSDARERKRFARDVHQQLHGRGIERTIEQIVDLLIQASQDAQADAGVTEVPSPQRVDEAVAMIRALGLQVLGDNEAGEIEIYNQVKRKRYRIGNLNRLTEFNLLQYVGHDVTAHDEAGEVMAVDVGHFKAAIALIAGNTPRLGSREIFGQGVFKAV